MQDIALEDTSVRVNDGSYHVIRFIRTGANATLQIDDFKTQRKNPSGRQMLVFNTQNLLQIGGKWNEGGLNRIDRPFIGVMAGFVFNGLRPLDLAKETHPLTKIQGKYCIFKRIFFIHKLKAPMFNNQRQKRYNFVTKIVLTYCEKKM